MTLEGGFYWFPRQVDRCILGKPAPTHHFGKVNIIYQTINRIL